MNTPSGNDIQRELEQRALRNVRGLVDKMEDADALDSRRQRRYLAGIVAGALAAAVLLAVALWVAQKRQPDTVVIEAGKAPQRQAPH
ncbi:MAG TPA: hypothetical protein VKR38_14645 [Usitatibacter sp.]|nr:hypothetical protein [Usitatibacter sp.]